ncbi:MAG: hypothetical protein AB7G06_06555 [Bdellovibrionales bacterium]
MKFVSYIRKNLMGCLIMAAFMVSILAPCMASAADICCTSDDAAISSDMSSNTSNSTQNDAPDADHCASHCGFQTSFSINQGALVQYETSVAYLPDVQSALSGDCTSGFLRPPQA